jgi:hypothetical protein
MRTINVALIFGLIAVGSPAGANPIAKSTANVGVRSVNNVTKGLRDRIAATKLLPRSVRKLVAGMPAAARAATRGVVYSEVSAEARRAQVDLIHSADSGRTVYFGTKDAISFDTPKKGVRVMWTPYDPVVHVTDRSDRTSTVSIDKTFRGGSAHRRIAPVSGSPGTWLVKSTHFFFRRGKSMSREQSYVISGNKVNRIGSKTEAN